VAHPDLVPVCREVFDSFLGDKANQLDKQRPDVSVTARDLLAVDKTPGGVTEAGLRNNISVALQYLANWLGGNGAVADLQPDGGRGHRGGSLGRRSGSGCTTTSSSTTGRW